jgi:hypothetical protein
MSTKPKMMAMSTATAAALVCVGSAHAHHSISMFDISTPVWVKGRVVTYEPIAPHAMIELEAKTEDGRVERWTIEGPWPGRLNRILSQSGTSVAETFITPGDTIEVCGFALKKRFSAKRSHASADPSKNRFLHGHVIVMPDGRMQSWGAYGEMQNCVRPEDETQRWVEFLNEDRLARDLWCSGLDAYHRPFAKVAPEPFVDEVGQRINYPCK